MNNPTLDLHMRQEITKELKLMVPTSRAIIVDETEIRIAEDHETRGKLLDLVCNAIHNEIDYEMYDFHIKELNEQTGRILIFTFTFQYS